MEKCKILFVAGVWDENYNHPDEFATGFVGTYHKEINHIENFDPRKHGLSYTYGKSSDFATKIIQKLAEYASVLHYVNGGKYSDLQCYLEEARHYDYDIVFWLVDTADNLPEYKNIKEHVPGAMLITNQLGTESDLVLEFNKQPIDHKAYTDAKTILNSAYGSKPDYDLIKNTAEKMANSGFRLKIFDPLNNKWSEEFELNTAIEHVMNTLENRKV